MFGLPPFEVKKNIINNGLRNVEYYIINFSEKRYEGLSCLLSNSMAYLKSILRRLEELYLSEDRQSHLEAKNVIWRDEILPNETIDDVLNRGDVPTGHNFDKVATIAYSEESWSLYYRFDNSGLVVYVEYGKFSPYETALKNLIDILIWWIGYIEKIEGGEVEFIE